MDFRNAVVILTSNAGSQRIQMEALAKRIFQGEFREGVRVTVDAADPSGFEGRGRRRRPLPGIYCRGSYAGLPGLA